MMRKTFVIFGLLVVLVFSLYFYFKPKPCYHFSQKAFSSIIPPTVEWTDELITLKATDEIRDILSLKYQFLGKGKQAFSFVSEDEKYVVKFFNLSNVIPSWKDCFYPEIALKKQKKLKRLFFGYHNGYQELKEDTGLIWIHLKPTHDLRRTITLVDPQKNELHVDADRTIFVIQKKAEPILSHLSKLYEEGKSSEADQLIQAFYALVQRKVSKGFHDRDKIFQNNYGFVENQPIQFDLGKNKQMKNPKDEVEYFKAKIEQWKAEHGYPS